MSVGIGWDHTRTHTGMETTFHALFADFYASIGRLLDAASQVPDQPPRDFCFTCAGRGRIHDLAANGEGYIPAYACPTCGGSGVA